MRSMILQVVLLFLVRESSGRIVKRNPYAVQEYGQEFSSGSGYDAGYSQLSSGSGSSGDQFLQTGGAPASQGQSFFNPHFNPSDDDDSSSYGGREGLAPYEKLSQADTSGDKSLQELEEEANSKVKLILLQASINRKMAEEKIAKMRSNFGVGTFGYRGYEFPLKTEPFDLGMHQAIDLGTSLDTKSLKDSDGNIKLPVQTVFITKTVGVKIPQPYPLKQEVPVPAPYPIPVHSHSHPHSHPHYSSEGFSNSHAINFSHGLGGDDTGDRTNSLRVGNSYNFLGFQDNSAQSGGRQFGSNSINFQRFVPNQYSSGYAQNYQ